MEYVSGKLFGTGRMKDIPVTSFEHAGRGESQMRNGTSMKVDVQATLLKKPGTEASQRA